MKTIIGFISIFLAVILSSCGKTNLTYTVHYHRTCDTLDIYRATTWIIPGPSILDSTRPAFVFAPNQWNDSIITPFLNSGTEIAKIAKADAAHIWVQDTLVAWSPPQCPNRLQFYMCHIKWRLKWHLCGSVTELWDSGPLEKKISPEEILEKTKKRLEEEGTAIDTIWVTNNGFSD